MTDQGETFQRVTVAEAAGALGVSVATVRRRIRSGELEAETVIRPQGTAFMVRLPLDASANVSDAYDRDQPAGSTTRTQASPEQAMTSLIQTTIATVLGPLVAELAASRQQNERHTDRIADQAEIIGRQGAELERAASTIVTLNAALEARTASQDAKALRNLSAPDWRSPATWVMLVMATAIIGTAVLLVATR